MSATHSSNVDRQSGGGGPTMVHRGIGSSHSITVDNRDVKLDTGREDTRAISATTIPYVLVE